MKKFFYRILRSDERAFLRRIRRRSSVPKTLVRAWEAARDRRRQRTSPQPYQPRIAPSGA